MACIFPTSTGRDPGGRVRMSVPCGKTREGAAGGTQILCKHFDESTMFRLADAFENA